MKLLIALLERLCLCCRATVDLGRRQVALVLSLELNEEYKAITCQTCRQGATWNSNPSLDHARRRLVGNGMQSRATRRKSQYGLRRCRDTYINLAWVAI